MPHLNLKFFPTIDEVKKNQLVKELVDTIVNVMGCDERVVSVALEPIDEKLWDKKVYKPEVIDRANLLYKHPNY